MMNSIAHFAIQSLRVLGQGKSDALRVLIFHNIFEETDPIKPSEPTRASFRQQLGWIKQHYTPIRLDKAIRLQNEGRLPANAISITFDDGYKNNLYVAADELNRAGIEATFYISTGFTEGGMMWNDQLAELIRSSDFLDADHLGLGRIVCETPGEMRKAYQTLTQHIKYKTPEERTQLIDHWMDAAKTTLPDLMMTIDELKQLSRQGHEIGAHTIHHPILHTLDESAARSEIQTSKVTLEDWLEREVVGFAYPNGGFGTDFTERDAKIVKELGFLYAVSTDWGVNPAEADRFTLKRFTPWDQTQWKYQLRLLKG
jgi:peptidoglycan/xylan/chitin deacetylase (PgdA/CDA1 family)